MSLKKGSKIPSLKISVQNDEFESDVDSENSDSESSSSSSSDSGSESSGSNSDSSSSGSSSGSESEHSRLGNKAMVADAMDEDEVEIHVRLNYDPTKAKRSEKKEASPPPKVYKHPQSEFVGELDLCSEEALKQKLERAKRFGLETNNTHFSSDFNADKIYESLGLSSTAAQSGAGGLRSTALHIRGTDRMSTDHVFEYFEQFTPGGVEWIDDSSCNVIYSSHEAALICLHNMSRAIPDPSSPGEKASSSGEKASSPGEETKDDKDKASDDEIDMELDDNEESTKAKEDESKKDEIDDIDLGLDSDNEEEKQDEQIQDKKQASDDLEDGEIPDVEAKLPAASKFNELDLNSLPTDGRWRQGVTCKHSPIIFFRFATKDDRKQRGAEKRSKYYQKYGNPNFGGQRGLISSSKRQRLYEAKRQLDEQDAGLSAEAQEEISGLTRDMSDDDYDSTGEQWEEVEESDEQEEVDEEGASLAREVAELTRTSYSMRMRADDEEHRRNTSRSSRLGRSRDYLKGVSAQSRLGFKGVRSRLGKRTMSSRLGY